MSDEERFEELQGALKEYEKLLLSLKEDFALLVRHAPVAKKEINSFANNLGNPNFDQEEAKRCLAFTEKYGIRQK